MAITKLDVESLRSTTPPPVPWLTRGFLAQRAVTLMVGDAGTGKSTLALSMAQAVSQGTSFLGSDCPKHKVVVLDAENGESELHRRIVSLDLRDDISIADVTNFSLTVNLPEIEEFLIKEGNVGLLVLDSARRLWIEGNENESGEVSSMLMGIQQLARNFDMSVLLLHHMSKNSTIRGSGAWTEVPEIVVEVGSWRKDKEETRRYIKWQKCRMAASPSTKWVFLQSDNDGRVNILPAWYPKKDELWPDT